MNVPSKYTMRFCSNSVTRKKYDELHAFAVHLRDVKNAISKEVSSDIFRYLDVKPLAFVTMMRERHGGLVPSSFDKHLFAQVITAYQHKFDAIRRGLTFEKVTFEGFEFYKRKTKGHKKGDLKKVALKREQTPLSNCLTYLARYGSEGTVEYIQSHLEEADGKKQAFYANILRCIEAYGLRRLLALAVGRRERVMREKNRKPIEFKSLSFSGRSRKKDIVAYNSRYGSVVNAFVSLSGLGRPSFDIPVKYASKYHGSMADYHKQANCYEYVVTFDEKRREVTVNIAKDGERLILDVDEGCKVVGIDVNVKHNLLTLSDGTSYDYDRRLVNDYCKLLSYLDNMKKEYGEGYRIGRRYRIKLAKMKEKMVRSEEGTVAQMCKALQTQGVRHVVMEDLDGHFGRSHVKDKQNDDVNFNRVAKYLGISSLKGVVEHVGRKYGIAVSTVQPSYTSKMCPMCGCIEDENRPTQEDFCCVECGHKANADVNAAVNIRNRVCEAVLRDALLKRMDNGSFKPKRMKREKVKKELLSHRATLQRRAENVRES